MMAPEVEVLIEVPRGSFLKRDPSGRVHFVSPLPCPFNYGAIPEYLGLEGDLLDAVVLGPRLPFGTRVRVRAWGAIAFSDRGLTDHKLICSHTPVTPQDHDRVMRFFRFYALCKSWLNRLRDRPGRNACDGWLTAQQALAHARPRPAAWAGPEIPY